MRGDHQLKPKTVVVARNGARVLFVWSPTFYFILPLFLRHINKKTAEEKAA